VADGGDLAAVDAVADAHGDDAAIAQPDQAAAGLAGADHPDQRGAVGVEAAAYGGVLRHRLAGGAAAGIGDFRLVIQLRRPVAAAAGAGGAFLGLGLGAGAGLGLRAGAGLGLGIGVGARADAGLGLGLKGLVE